MYKLCRCGKRIDYYAKYCEECTEQIREERYKRYVEYRLNPANKDKIKERNKAYDSFSRDKEAASFYASKSWKVLTNTCKSKYCAIDIFEYYINKKIIAGNLSHHIIERKENSERMFDIDNLIYLSDSNHNLMHRLYNQSNDMRCETQEMLFYLVNKWEKEFMNK
jgi:hypothetical protein